MSFESKSLRSFAALSPNGAPSSRFGLFPMGTMFAAISLGMNPSHAQSAVDAPAEKPKAQTNSEVQISDADQLPTVIVEDGYAAYKPDHVASPKFTEPLRDTAMSITVLSKELIADQGVLTLRQILSNVPGITFGAGEGGSGFGDKINIRGFDASNDISIDGIRDSAQTSRTDPFNIEQIEIFKGASSVNSGAGAVGGSINEVSKVPEAMAFRRLSGGVGTQDYGRLTADVNQPINDGAAFRINAMVHQNKFAERDVTSAKRWGVAPSVKFGMKGPTQWTLSYFHQYDDNIPDYGVPFRNFKPVPGVARSNYYGFSNVDSQQIKNDALTSILEHSFNSEVKLRNATRIASNKTDATTDGVEGDVCVKIGDYPLGTVMPVSTTSPPPLCTTAGTYTPRSGPNGQIRNTDNDILVNQTDVTWNFNTGAVAHTAVTGVQISKETYHLDGGSILRNGNGTTYPVNPASNSPYPTTSLYSPNNFWTLPLNPTFTTKTDTSVNDRAIYAFDTIKFGQQWILNGGLRYENNRSRATTFTRSAATATTPPGEFALAANNPLSTNDKLLSYRLGLIYKPMEIGTVYAAFGNSKLPTSYGSNTLGACANTNATSTANASNTCAVKPETAISYEVGTKWDVLDQKLALTADVFRTERTNFKVASGDATVAFQQLDGQSRVDGIELGAAGQINKNWSVTAGYTYQRSEILRSIAKNSPPTKVDPQKGHALANVPGNSASLWTTYEWDMGLQLGYGLNYSSTVYQTATTPDKLPGYTVQNALVGYKLSKDLSLAMNINNLTNRVYYTQLRGQQASGWVNPGTGRNAVLTANYSF